MKGVNMAIFDYITSDDLDNLLKQIIKKWFFVLIWRVEGSTCLAGIIEAVLLVTSWQGYATEEASNGWDQQSIMQDKKVISEKTSDLSSVIKSYRV
jgi:hypothetical protein